jgi:hypothetical protein
MNASTQFFRNRCRQVLVMNSAIRQELAAISLRASSEMPTQITLDYWRDGRCHNVDGTVTTIDRRLEKGIAEMTTTKRQLMLIILPSPSAGYGGKQAPASRDHELGNSAQFAIEAHWKSAFRFTSVPCKGRHRARLPFDRRLIVRLTSISRRIVVDSARFNLHAVQDNI